MMNVRALFHWFYDTICNYNLFMVEENEYGDDDEEPKDPATVLKHQKYATCLYVPLLLISLYILFYIALVNPQPQTIFVWDITPAIFNKLYLEHRETLSCPCSTTTVPFKDFVSNTITFHPVCSSMFVSQQWIEALYLPDASTYGVSDFRTTASYQFELLSSLCSLSEKTVFENEIDLDNKEFITVDLLSEDQVQSEVNATANYFKNSASTGIISFLNYLRITSQTNYLVSALNTNLLIAISNGGDRYYFYRFATVYFSYTIGGSPYGDQISCSNENPTSAASFVSLSSDPTAQSHVYWMEPREKSKIVNGFFVGCTPLEALLRSTLDCLYDIKCLQLLIDHFPALNQTYLNWTDFVLSSIQTNLSLNDHLLTLFIDDWSTKMNYSKYLYKCAPWFCTYTITDHTNIYYATTLLISLYGGIIIILRLIAPILVKVLLTFKCHSTNVNVASGTFQMRLHKFTQSIKQLNLFKAANDRTEKNIKQQKIITRLYLTLLSGSLFALLLFTSLSTQTVPVTKLNPSLTTYKNLQVLYKDTLQCPCSTTVIPYKTFMSIYPILHQVCSSDLVTSHWISILKYSTHQTVPIDWRNIAFSQFQLLSDLCRLANNTISDAVHEFTMQLFITSSVPREIDFNIQLNATLDQFFQSTITYFGLLVDAVRLLMQVDQPYRGPSETYSEPIDYPNLLGMIVYNSTNYQQTSQVKFLLSGTRDINSTLVNCICATDPHCRSSAPIYKLFYEDEPTHDFNIVYIVPGLLTGCSAIDSLLISTLECFYSDSDCFQLLLNHIQEAYFKNVEYPVWFHARPLTHDTISTRFLSNTSVGTIVKNLMIEQWNASFSYNRFYESCAPSNCTYSQTVHTNTVLQVIITLVSTICGLISSLRLITPPIVKLGYRLLAMINKKQQKQQQQIRLNWFNRLKVIIRNLATLLYNILADLNIFSLRDFGKDVDRTTAKRLGQWSTRLYIVLFTISIVVLILYTIIQPQARTETFPKLPLDVYNQLIEKYGDQLKCPCSSIASTHNQSVQIKPIFHEICSSPFISDEWRINLTTGLVSDLSSYAQRDYRRFLSAHLQFLSGLCQLSIQSVNNTIKQFLASLFVTAHLLSEKTFHERLDLLIKHSQINASKTFDRILFLIRSINHGNAIISTYGTNFEYIPSSYQLEYIPYLFTQSIIYDDQCSCGLYTNCTSQAYFIGRNPSEIIPIKGFKIGCTPSESFRASTLECFYDVSCINLIQEYTNYKTRFNSTNHPLPLSATMNQSSINTTIAQLINDLFVERWSTTINYSSYYNQCLPALCFYTYIQRFNPLYIVTLLLCLEGGLSIILKWICPKIFQILFKVLRYRQNRMRSVQSRRPLGITSTSIEESMPTNVPLQTNIFLSVQCCYKIVLTCILLIIIITVLVIFSIYVARPVLSMNTTISMNTDTTTSISSTTTSTGCPLKFQSIPLYTNHFCPDLQLPVVGDFNADNRFDLVFFCRTSDQMNVLLGNGNGTFRIPITFSVGSFVMEGRIAVGDFNNDSRLDIVFIDRHIQYMGILIGNGDGTFQATTVFFIGYDSSPEQIIVADFNNDTFLDIVVVNERNHNVGILFGNGNGNFSIQTTFSTGSDSFPKSITVVDLNNDNYLDIVVVNSVSKSIGVFIGYGNGTFQAQKTSFTGYDMLPYYIAVGDFNDDTLLDVIFSFENKNIFSVMFGYGNGTFGAGPKFTIETGRIVYPISVGDFNCDRHLDIVFGQEAASSMDVLIGYGEGKFNKQLILESDYYISYSSVAVGDFNGDNYQDIIVFCTYYPAMYILLSTCQCCVRT